MTRRALTAVAVAAVAAVGVAQASSERVSQAATPQAEVAAAEPALRTVARFRDAVVLDPYNTGPMRLFTLDRVVDNLDNRLAAIPEDRDDVAQVRTNLRAAAGHMRDYVVNGGNGDVMAMQMDAWRLLWVINRLPPL